MALDWKDLSGIIGKIAPIAGTLIGGPAGAAIGGLVAAAIGTDNTPDAVNAAIATDPAKALQLAQWEGDNKVKLQQMMYAHADNMIAADTASQQADAADRASARTAAVTGNYAQPLFWLSVAILIGSFATEVAVLFLGVPAKADPLIVGRILGWVDAIALMVMNFNYGSTSSGRRTVELLAQSGPTTGAGS